CEQIRQSGDDTPILFVSARTDESTVVKAITHGADDYLRKPFGMEELKARMNKIIKKFSPPTSTITVGALTIDPIKRMVTIAGNVIALGRKEMEILIILAKRAGDVVTRESIMTSLYDSADTY